MRRDDLFSETGTVKIKDFFTSRGFSVSDSKAGCILEEARSLHRRREKPVSESDLMNIFVEVNDRLFLFDDESIF